MQHIKRDEHFKRFAEYVMTKNILLVFKILFTAYTLTLSLFALSAKQFHFKDLLLTGKLVGDPPPHDFSSVITQSFKSTSEAKKYTLERRLTILKKFTNLVEPYFGTKNLPECQLNLKSSILTDKNESVSVALQVPTFSQRQVIHDCLWSNNSHLTHIEMISCGTDYYDIRLSIEKSKQIFYKQYFKCKH
jgi:hypothetical protein